MRRNRQGKDKVGVIDRTLMIGVAVSHLVVVAQTVALIDVGVDVVEYGIGELKQRILSAVTLVDEAKPNPVCGARVAEAQCILIGFSPVGILASNILNGQSAILIFQILQLRA